eukprot:3451077-Amphidinium_carterae.1
MQPQSWCAVVLSREGWITKIVSTVFATFLWLSFPTFMNRRCWRRWLNPSVPRTKGLWFEQKCLDDSNLVLLSRYYADSNFIPMVLKRAGKEGVGRKLQLRQNM